LFAHKWTIDRDASMRYGTSAFVAVNIPVARVDWKPYNCALSVLASLSMYSKRLNGTPFPFTHKEIKCDITKSFLSFTLTKASRCPE
jgi:hypothetical protein